MHDVHATGAARVAAAPGDDLKPARWAFRPARLARMDRLCGLALVAADAAIADARLDPAAWGGAAGAGGLAVEGGERARARGAPLRGAIAGGATLFRLRAPSEAEAAAAALASTEAALPATPPDAPATREATTPDAPATREATTPD